jgi:hypothetical protein
VEIAGILVLYGVYELLRGLVSASMPLALEHAHDIVALERDAGVFVEPWVQDAARAVPGLIGALGLAYVTMHLAVTAAVLAWLYRRRSYGFPIVRTTLVAASALALVGYFLFPTAPPRLAGVGLADTVTDTTHVNLSSNLLGVFYNPIAAVPSLHFGFALIVGIALVAFARHRWVRLAGALYPAFVLLVIVATGNHFLFDAAPGAIVAGAGYVVARRLAR